MIGSRTSLVEEAGRGRRGRRRRRRRGRRGGRRGVDGAADADGAAATGSVEGDVVRVGTADGDAAASDGERELAALDVAVLGGRRRPLDQVRAGAEREAVERHHLRRPSPRPSRSSPPSGPSSLNELFDGSRFSVKVRVIVVGGVSRTAPSAGSDVSSSAWASTVPAARARARAAAPRRGRRRDRGRATRAGHRPNPTRSGGDAKRPVTRKRPASRSKATGAAADRPPVSAGRARRSGVLAGDGARRSRSGGARSPSAGAGEQTPARSDGSWRRRRRAARSRSRTGRGCGPRRGVDLRRVSSWFMGLPSVAVSFQSVAGLTCVRYHLTRRRVETRHECGGTRSGSA